MLDKLFYGSLCPPNSELKLKVFWHFYLYSGFVKNILQVFYCPSRCLPVDIMACYYFRPVDGAADKTTSQFLTHKTTVTMILKGWNKCLQHQQQMYYFKADADRNHLT